MIEAGQRAALPAPGVSVVLPTHQRRELVKQAVASVLAQSYRDFELIVVDDGSTDGTGYALAARDVRLRYQWQANCGVAAARNAGIRLARAPIIAFLDSDDRWEAEHLALVVGALQDHPEAVVAFARPLSPRNGSSAGRLIEPLPRLLLGNYVGLTSGVALRRDAALAVGGFDERLGIAEDADLWLRLALRGGKFVLVPRRTVIKRLLRDSLMSNRGRGEYAEALEQSTAATIEELEARGDGRADGLLVAARGRQRFITALHALDRGDDVAARAALTDACFQLPELSVRAQSVLNHLRWSMPEPCPRSERFRQLEVAARLWPDQDSLTAVRLRGQAILAALGAGRPVQAVSLLSGAGRQTLPSLRGATSARAIRHRLRRAVRRRRRRTAAAALHLRGGLRRGLTIFAHRLLLRTGRSPVRHLWRLGYEACARLTALYLSRGEKGSAAYIAGSIGAGDSVWGLSDIDLVIVVPSDPAGPGIARGRVRRRWCRLRRRLPTLCELMLEPPKLYEDDELADEARATTLTHGLDMPREEPDGVPMTARERRRERAGAERPGLFGPMADWRLLVGSDRRPGVVERPAHERRIASWMELQFWWLQAFRACVNPNGPRAPFLCAKLVAESARIWLWLARGEKQPKRREVLERALVALPEEESALRRSLELLGALHTSPSPPLSESLGFLLRMSGRISRLIAGQLEDVGTTEVRLESGGRHELVMPAGSIAALAELASPETVRVLPLADWRARVWSRPPDEAFAPIAGDPSDPVLLRAAAHAGEAGPYPALRAEGLLVLPSLKGARLRAVQCAATDPVSLALADGADQAAFPDVPGWSARDSGRRAVAEHGSWLNEEGRDAAPTVKVLGRLLTAARAALFLESLEAGAPELAVSVGATAERLSERTDWPRGLAEEAYASYRTARTEGGPPDAGVVDAFRKAVARLPAYGGTR